MPPLNGAEAAPAKKPVEIATCMPVQHTDPAAKLEWLNKALGETDCDLFLTPQEMFGGHYGWQLSGRTADLHLDRDWLIDAIGRLAKKHTKHIGVGGCCKSPNSGATEDYLYLDDTGGFLGLHKKFALPSYDDMRTGGHGQLWPETSFLNRATPIEIPKLRLRVATQFCWETYAQALWVAYTYSGVNLVTHPIKFSPTGWLNNKKLADGKLHIMGFGNAPKSTVWEDRLIMASRHQVMCPIAVSCNSWNLGDKFRALVGHVDEIKKTTTLLRPQSRGGEQVIHTFKMLPEVYTGMDHLHSAGAYKQHSGTVEGYSELGEWKMHCKMRRLEAHLVGGTTKLDCHLRVVANRRQKPSSVKRALGTGLQKVRVKRGHS